MRQTFGTLVLYLTVLVTGCSPSTWAAINGARETFDAVERVRLGCAPPPTPPEAARKEPEALTHDEKRAILVWTLLMNQWLSEVQKRTFEAPEPAPPPAP